MKEMLYEVRCSKSNEDMAHGFEFITYNIQKLMATISLKVRHFA